MLSIFPELLTFQILGITIIRIFIGLTGLYFSFKVFRARTQISTYIASFKFFFSYFSKIGPWFLTILFFLAGGMMLIGLYTQIVAIVLAILFSKLLVIDRGSHKCFGNGSFIYLVLLIISLSFLVLGPGIFAFDLPL